MLKSETCFVRSYNGPSVRKHAKIRYHFVARNANELSVLKDEVLEVRQWEQGGESYCSLHTVHLHAVMAIHMFLDWFYLLEWNQNLEMGYLYKFGFSENNLNWSQQNQ